MSAGPMICVRCHLRIGHRRGLCDWCHARTRRVVAEGTTTWAELERQGLVLPAEEGDYDTDEGPMPGDLTSWFVIFGIGLFFAVVGLLLWAAALVPDWVVGMVFTLGIGAMLFVLADAVVRCRRGAPPPGRE
jgi:hypothetical protein